VEAMKKDLLTRMRELEEDMAELRKEVEASIESANQKVESLLEGIARLQHEVRKLSNEDDSQEIDLTDFERTDIPF
jgi:predicted  nucleic acid-binding Zn-ribbon protein